jgi:choline kinase
LRAVILSAGKGSRLLPLTETIPKCLLPIAGTTVLGLQLATLEAEGITEVTVVTGFRPDLVEAEIKRSSRSMLVTPYFNPFFQVADNLASCWMVREHMRGDVLLINGDTLFEPSLLRRVLDSPQQPVQVTIDRKTNYDSDDMKVSFDGDRLTAISKELSGSQIHGESIGMLRFTGEGVALFTDMLERMLRTQEGIQSWYLKAVDALAKLDGSVGFLSIEGYRWAELDTLEDYENVKALFGGSS